MAQNNTQQSQKRNYHLGTGIALGLTFGAALGTAFDQLALGVAFGTIVGAVVAIYRQSKRNTL